MSDTPLFDLIDPPGVPAPPFPARPEFDVTCPDFGIACSACGAALPCVVYEGDRCHDCYRKEHPARLVATPEKPKKTKKKKE